MKPKSSINLVEALRENRAKCNALLGMLSLFFLFLSIYLFGKEARFSLIAFPAYLVTCAGFLISGLAPARKNPWYARLFALINGLMLALALAGWIWILYLAQENPGGRYAALASLHFTSYIVFFLLIYLPCFAGLLISLTSYAKNRGGRT